MDLIQIRDSIEKMTKFHQIAILRILNDNEDVIINENRNGVHVNLTDLGSNVIDNLLEYVKYVTTQEKTLNKDEQEKESIKNIYFS